MDGLQKWLNRSVKARLSFWMSLIIIVMSVFSAGLSFTFSFMKRISCKMISCVSLAR